LFSVFGFEVSGVKHRRRDGYWRVYDLACPWELTSFVDGLALLVDEETTPCLGLRGVGAIHLPRKRAPSYASRRDGKRFWVGVEGVRGSLACRVLGPFETPQLDWALSLAAPEPALLRPYRSLPLQATIQP